MRKVRVTFLVVFAAAINSFLFGQTGKTHKTMPNTNPAHIQYWIGSGTNEATVVLYFCNGEDATNAYAFGYRWNSPQIGLVYQMMNDVNANNSRIYLGNNGSTMTIFSYTDPENNISFNGNGTLSWMYEVNGTMNGVAGVGSQSIQDGDVFTFFCYECIDGGNWGVDMSSVNIIYITDPNATPNTYTIHAGFGNEWASETFGNISPVGDSTLVEGSSITYYFSPNAGYHVGSVTLGGVEQIQHVTNNSCTIADVMKDDTLWVMFAVDKNNTITTNDMVYWVGEGENEVVFAVNWCNPEIAFAWGYRFEGEKVSVAKVMEDIQAADPRFGYIVKDGGVDDITYNDSAYSLAKRSESDYWAYNVNEISAAMIGSQYVFHQDVIEWGVGACGLSDDFWNNVWTMAITPVAAPSLVNNTTLLQQPAIETSIYPNPTNDHFNLSINGIEGVVSMKITDVGGKIIQTEQFHVNENTVKHIEVSHFAKGIYFIHLQNNNVVQTQKLTVY